MFTGIIKNTGLIEKWHPTKNGGRLSVKTKKLFKKIKRGESIAVNGCCLTVLSYKNKILTFDVSDETFKKTTFKNYKKGWVVNLERAMLPTDRFGGHFVLGHVDGVGKIESLKKNSGSVVFSLSCAKKFASLLIEKGSVTVDGISLTVCDLKKNEFNIYIIPHSFKQTNLKNLKNGDPVNLEFDVLGKYIKRNL